MPIIIVGVALLILIAFLLYKAILHSPFLGKNVEQILNEDYSPKETDPKDVIRDIESNKQALDKKTKENKRLTQKVEKQTEMIDSYLNPRKRSYRKDRDSSKD